MVLSSISIRYLMAILFRISMAIFPKAFIRKYIGKLPYRIEVEEPARAVIKINNSDDSGTFEFICNEEGLFEFRGKIVYDSIQSFPFEYKFLVVKKDRG